MYSFWTFVGDTDLFIAGICQALSYLQPLHDLNTQKMGVTTKQNNDYFL